MSNRRIIVGIGQAWGWRPAGWDFGFGPLNCIPEWGDVAEGSVDEEGHLDAK